jgi:peptidoglycan/LPS O-acetylase OafA/YrhL
VAALVVACFHWSNFWISVMGPNSRAPLIFYPYYELLFVFYRVGNYAVDIFFGLSGFIFCWKYAERVSKKEISAKEFFILRFSRLYPLHALTLALIAGMQYLHFQKYSAFFFGTFNDIYHFFLNVLLIPIIGLEKGYSFNTPIWSISVESLLYFIFFCLCLFQFMRARYLILIVLCAAVISVPSLESHFARGFWSFFLGCLVFYGYRWVIEKEKSRFFLKTFLFIVPALIVFAIMELQFEWFSTLSPKPLFNFYLRKVLYMGFLFPGMLFVLALLDSRQNRIGPKVSFIGNMSYSSYLLHFPLQIFFFLFVGNSPAIYAQPSIFLAYFFILISLSFGSYKYFEVPIQNAIRRRYCWK